MGYVYQKHTCFVCGLDSVEPTPKHNRAMLEWAKEHPEKIKLLRVLIRKGHEYGPHLKRMFIMKTLCPLKGSFDGIELIPLGGRVINQQMMDQPVIYQYED